MLNASLYDYSDAYTLVEGRITVVGQVANDKSLAVYRNDKVIFKNWSLFTSCMSNIQNAEVDNAEDLDIVMPMYNLLKYGDICKKHQLVYGNIVGMNLMMITNSKPFKFISSITDNNNNTGNTNLKIIVTLKYLSNFCEITHDLNWSENCVICEADWATTFAQWLMQDFTFQ